MNSRIIRSLYMLLAVVVVSLSLAACSVTTATIVKAELSHDYADGKATDVTTSFAPEDATIHCVVTLNNAPDDTKVKAVWTAVDANDGAIKDQKLDEAVLETGSGTLDFTLANDQHWPKGTYKVDISLNDKPDRTVEFRVE